MKKMIMLALGVFLATTASVYADELPREEGLPSPYFIDEVHCEGNHVHEVRGGFYAPDEVEAANKVESHESCENLLKAFGIVKYSWISPDDLERTATIMKQSEYFDSVELAVKKSELQNHVHVFLKVKPKPQWFSTVGNDFKYYAGNASQGFLINDKLSGEISNRHDAPSNTQTWGISVEGYGSSSPLAVSPAVVSSDDYEKLQNRNYYLADLSLKEQGSVSNHVTYDLNMDLTSDNIASDGSNRLAFDMQTDLLFTRPINLVRGNAFIGPALLLGNVMPYQVSSQNYYYLLLPGFVFGYDYGQDFWNNAKFKISYYNSFQNNSIFDYAFNGQYHMGFIDTFLIGAFDMRLADNPVLPQDRLPLTGPYQGNTYIGLSKIYGSDKTSRQQVSAVVGLEVLSYAASTPTYEQVAPYVGLKYKLTNSDWNLNLSAGYYFQRTY